MFDKYLAELDALGAAIVVTADHGMKPKHVADGSPARDLRSGPARRVAGQRQLPASSCRSPTPTWFITARWDLLPPPICQTGANHADIIARLAARSRDLMSLWTRPKPCDRFELPGDRIGDIVMISTENMTIGTSAHRHDLAALNEPLRSHGGLDRTGSALHRQPQACRSARRAGVEQFRCLHVCDDGGCEGVMVKRDAGFTVRHEPMRIAGRKVDADGVVEVRYPVGRYRDRHGACGECRSRAQGF